VLKPFDMDVLRETIRVALLDAPKTARAHEPPPDDGPNTA
jgi:hypothetical protein